MSVALAVGLLRVGRLRAVVRAVRQAVGVRVHAFTGVADAIPVGVRLSEVRNTGAVVAGRPATVRVRICLIAVGHGGAVVPRVSDAIGVVVPDHLAGVPHAVAIVVGLGEVRRGRTVVARVAHTVGVRVELSGIEGQRADIRAVGTTVAVRVVVVAEIAASVGVLIRLIRIGQGRADVAGVAVSVAIRVELIVVRRRRAVVLGVGDPVVVTVSGGRKRIGARGIPRGAGVRRHARAAGRGIRGAAHRRTAKRLSARSAVSTRCDRAAVRAAVRAARRATG